MNVIKTGSFDKAFENLPAEIQRLYAEQENRFKENWRDPRLHLKRIRNLEKVFAFRITRRYRVFFYFHQRDAAVLFDIDHRKDIYRP